MVDLNEDLVISKLPKRPVNSNKGTFGKALIIAGSKNYPGAAILSVLAAARTGAGLVTLASCEDVYKVTVPKIPFATFLDFAEVTENINLYDAILIGPGLKLADLGAKIKDWLGSANDKKFIFDAESLNEFSKNHNWYKQVNVDAILTPHPGEMSRLTNLSIDHIQKGRELIISKYSKDWNKTIILKGANTLIASPEGKIYKSEFANPLLATAGTGDVLSGIIAGLLAQGLTLIDAATCAVYIQGLAGENLKIKFGTSGALATDLIDEIPGVINFLSRKIS